MATTTPFPVELWLQIFEEVAPSDLWISIRKTCRQFRACAEDIAKEQMLPKFTLQMSYTLGSGSHHRWYDVRGSVLLRHKNICELNPQYAEFEKVAFSPERCHEKAMQKWHSICAHGIGPDHVWRVVMGDGKETLTPLPSIVISESHDIWCDWRELLNSFFSKANFKGSFPLG